MTHTQHTHDPAILDQVLAKSCKMIPVMIMGTLVGGKRYSVIEYVCAGLIAGGISLFAAQVNMVACCLPP